MFLDEKLLEVGRKFNTSMAFDECKPLISQMINICFDSLETNIKGNHNDAVILAQFKRVNNVWAKVAETLEKENKGFIRKDGFKAFVESKPEFAGIFF